MLLNVHHDIERYQFMPKIRTTLIYTVAVAALMCSFAVLPAYGQEESVKPGINSGFTDDLDVGTFLTIFETESRAIYKHRNDLVAAMALKPGMNVADIGAGTGFFSAMMAKSVGPKGKVYAVDIAKNFLVHINENAKAEGIKNIKTVHCDNRSTGLKKNSIDFAYICDVYHHFEYPYSTMESLHAAMRPGGILLIVDFERIKGISREWTLGHVRCGKGTVADEVKDAGFDLIEEIPMMEEQYILKFKKRG